MAIDGKHYENYMKHVTRKRKDLWTIATPVKNTDGEVEKILSLQLTLQNKKNKALNEGQIRALNIAMKADFSFGKIFDFNEIFNML